MISLTPTLIIISAPNQPVAPRLLQRRTSKYVSPKLIDARKSRRSLGHFMTETRLTASISREENQREKGFAKFLIRGGQSAKVLKLVAEPLDTVSLPLKTPAVMEWLF